MARLVDLNIDSKAGKVDLDPLYTDAEKGAIYVRRFELSGVAATDVKSGTPKGTREYPGITIEKRLDGASPALFQLFTNHTGIKATFRVYKVDGGAEATAGQVTLTVTVGGDNYQAWVSSYKLVVPDIETRVKDDPDEPYEIITFTFAKIEFHKSGTNHKGSPAEVVVSDNTVAHN